MVLIIMGVAGSGKTSVGKMLSEKLGWKYYEGDNYHPKENVEKMSHGIPLNDEDRIPWLLKLRTIIEDALSNGESIILSSSALKEAYRKILKVNDQVKFIYLKGSYELIEARMKMRKDHFMKPGMLKSQFEALEEPADAIAIDIDQPLEKIVENILQKIE